MLNRFKTNRHVLLVKVSISSATKENIMEVPKKFKIKISSIPEIPLLGICLNKTKSTMQKKRYKRPNVHCRIIYNT